MQFAKGTKIKVKATYGHVHGKRRYVDQEGKPLQGQVGTINVESWYMVGALFPDGETYFFYPEQVEPVKEE